MLKALLKPFVTSAASGVSTRYLTVIVSTALTVLGLLGWLDDSQVEALKTAVPELLAAIAAVIALAVPVYATVTKSSSDKAHQAAKEIDAKVPESAPVVIKTPGAAPDIVEPAASTDKTGR